MGNQRKIHVVCEFMHLYLHVLIFTCTVETCTSTHVLGSLSPLYQSCCKRCVETGCYEIGNEHYLSPPSRCSKAQACKMYTGKEPPLSLTLTAWSCEDDCKYECMRVMEMWRVMKGRTMAAKYFGKWHFRRVLGVQEFLSFLFSLMNLSAHLHNFLILRRTEKKVDASQAQVSYPYIRLWQVYSVLHMNAWLWSAVFHARDHHITEMLDYFSADASVFFGVYIVVERCGNLRHSLKSFLSSIVAGGFLWLVYQMAFVHFDHGYNVKICLILGVGQGFVWMFWAWATNHSGRFHVWAFFLLLYTSMLAEVYDFAPWWKLLDAHALWHASTIPLTYLWYHFISSDALWVTQRGGKAE